MTLLSRARIWPLTGVLSVCLMTMPRCAEAADTQVTHTHHRNDVEMMIGGLHPAIDQGETRAEEVGAGLPTFDNAEPASVIVLRDGSATTGSMQGRSNSVASRVMALSSLIGDAAKLVELDPALLMAVIDVESGGNPRAVSSKGATGLMQLMPRTGALHGAHDLFDPRQNVVAGARYLRALVGQFGNLALALAAYNAGEGAVQKYGGQIPPYAETMSYVPKVIARYRWYRTATGSSSVLPIDASSDANASATLRISAVTVPTSRPRAAASN